MNSPAATGGFTLIVTDNDAWTLHDQGDDIAVHPVSVPPPLYISNFVPEEMLLTREAVKTYDIGPGDEVFFVGRFVNHEGRQKNWPALRFGNISMMPWEPIRQEETGIEQESFVVEGRSIGGYSGAPVFVHQALPWAPKGTPALYLGGGSVAFTGHGASESRRFWIEKHDPAEPFTGFATLGEPPAGVATPAGWRPTKHKKAIVVPVWLLGVDWGHLRTKEDVVDPQGEKTPDKLRVLVNSGMSCVVPAWKLRELLYHEKLVMARGRGEGELKEGAD